MTQSHSARKSPSANSDNCIIVERDNIREAAIKAARKRKKWEKGRKFEKIPILKGYILREVKDEQ